MFEEIDQGLVNGLRGIVGDAILNNEPRISVNEIEVDSSKQEEGLLLISIDYTIRSTNNRYNMVYPYYINEATPIK
jgi:phage baseplate assembly protein W